MSRHEDEIARLVARRPHCRAEVTPAETLCARGRPGSVPLNAPRIMALRPCGDWPRSRVVDMIGGRTVTLSDVLREESIQAQDRLWVACQPGVWAEPDVTLRWLAADFAAAVLPIFEGARPGDARPRRAIEAARLYALGLIGPETRAAAVVAAEADAARAAGYRAWSAAWAATWAARAATGFAWAAAGDARSAAGDARSAEAGTGVWVATWAAQIRRVLDLLGAP